MSRTNVEPEKRFRVSSANSFSCQKRANGYTCSLSSVRLHRIGDFLLLSDFDLDGGDRGETFSVRATSTFSRSIRKLSRIAFSSRTESAATTSASLASAARCALRTASRPFALGESATIRRFVVEISRARRFFFTKPSASRDVAATDRPRCSASTESDSPELRSRNTRALNCGTVISDPLWRSIWRRMNCTATGTASRISIAQFRTDVTFRLCNCCIVQS